MKKNNIFWLLPIMILAMVGAVMAVTYTVQEPDTNEIMKDTFRFNFSFASVGGKAAQNITGINASFSADGGAYHQFAKVTFKNTTTNTSWTNNTKAKFNPALSDTATYSFKFVIINSSGKALSTITVTGITIDNSVPKLTWTSPTANGDRINQGDGISMTCANTSKAVLYFDKNAYPMVISGSTCSYSSAGIPSDKTYTEVYVKAYDLGAKNETKSAVLKNVRVEADGTTATNQAQYSSASEESTVGGGKSSTGIIIVIFIVVVAIIATSSSKNK